MAKKAYVFSNSWMSVYLSLSIKVDKTGGRNSVFTGKFFNAILYIQQQVQLWEGSTAPNNHTFTCLAEIQVLDFFNFKNQ